MNDFDDVFDSHMGIFEDESDKIEGCLTGLSILIVPTIIYIVLAHFASEWNAVLVVRQVIESYSIFIVPAWVFISFVIGYRRSLADNPPPPPNDLSEPKMFVISLAKAEKWQGSSARVLMKALLQLANDKYAVNFYINTSNNETKFAVWYESKKPDLALFNNALQSVYPDLEAQEEVLQVCRMPHTTAYHVFLPEKSHPFFETMTATSFRQDPLEMLVRAMDAVLYEESLTFCIRVYDTVQFDGDQINDLDYMTWDINYEAKSHLHDKKYIKAAVKTFQRASKAKITHHSSYTHSDNNRFREKLSKKNYAVHIFMWFNTTQFERIKWFEAIFPQVQELALLNPMIAIGQTQTLRVETQTELEFSQMWNRPNRMRKTPSRRHTFILTDDELASLWHIPHDAFTAKNLHWGISAPLPEPLKSIDGVLVGISGKDPVYFPNTKQFKTEHMATIGKTGLGKSSLMQTLIHDDIYHKRGVIVIDPKGDLVRDILRYSIPPHREDDVVVLDAHETQQGKYYPPPLNPLAGSPKDLNTIMYSLFRSGWSDSRASRWLSLALNTLIFFDEATILDIWRIFTDIPFREKLLHIAALNKKTELSAFALQKSWLTFDGTNDKDISINAIYDRLNTLASDGQLMSITCNPYQLKISELIAQNKIILVALGRDYGDDEASEEAILGDGEMQLIGTSLMSQIYTLTMAGKIPKRHRPYTLYVDEADLFKTDRFKEMLAKVRSRGLGLVLSTQSINQLIDGVQQAFEDNIGTLISFGVSADNDRRLSAYMSPPFERNDLTKLNRYQAAVYMKDNDGIQHQAFLMDTIPPPERLAVERLAQSINNNQQYSANELDSISRHRASQVEQTIRQKSIANLGLKTYSEVTDSVLEKYARENDTSRYNVKIYYEEDEQFVFPDEE